MMGLAKFHRWFREMPQRILLAALALMLLFAASCSHCYNLQVLDGKRLDEHKQDQFGVYVTLGVIAVASLLAAAYLFSIRPKPTELDVPLYRDKAGWGKEWGKEPPPLTLYQLFHEILLRSDWSGEEYGRWVRPLRVLLFNTFVLAVLTFVSILVATILFLTIGMAIDAFGECPP